jgi:hypothetical protein
MEVYSSTVSIYPCICINSKQPATTKMPCSYSVAKPCVFSILYSTIGVLRTTQYCLYVLQIINTIAVRQVLRCYHQSTPSTPYSEYSVLHT